MTSTACHFGDRATVSYYIAPHSEPAEKVECSDNTYDDQLDLSAVQALAQ